jgi:dienelactone hydrolase
MPRFLIALLLASIATPALADEQPSDWVIRLKDRDVGEEAVVTRGLEAGREMRSTGEARLIQQPFRYEQTLRVGADGAFESYALKSDSHTLEVVASEQGLRITGTVVGRSTEVELPAPHPVVCLDNLVFSHYDELGRRAIASEGAFEFVCLVPQALVAPGARFVPGTEVVVRGADGSERAALRGKATIANTLVKLVYDAETGVAYHVDVPAQALQARRKGWSVVAADTPHAPPATGYREEEVSFSSPYGTIPGTLTLPTTGEGPFPTALFLPGSGPQDRHSTVGPNRPLQDLARGLAARGVASLRFDKRAFLIRAALAAAKSRAERQAILEGLEESLDAEYVQDALAALAWLRQREGVDPTRLSLLGHSLGSLAAAVVSTEEGGAVQKLVLMAAPGRPFDVILEEQLAFQAQLAGKDEAAARAQAKGTVEGVRRALRGELPATQRVLGATGAYWKDVCGRDLPAILTASPLPVLLLHGAKDCQVAQQDFEVLSQAIASREVDSRATLCQGLNHLFMPVEGQSTGAEYADQGAVAKEPIQAVADFLLGP